MSSTLWPVLFFIFMGLLIGLGMLGVSLLVGAKHKGVRKNNIYESGVNPVGGAHRRYDIKFYLTAVLFLLFDVEVVFLVPWVLSLKKSLNPLLWAWELMFFLVVLLVGYLFVLFSKSLDWEK
ncbi:MAG: NADH-quinone oxidoreductase subunit A [Bacteriovoracaceae bacterium]|nr:NADH-quinone oxidoreductase subunit A [Bacteriovoracaceae bacterium]